LYIKFYLFITDMLNLLFVYFVILILFLFPALMWITDNDLNIFKQPNMNLYVNKYDTIISDWLQNQTNDKIDQTIKKKKNIY